MHKGLQSDESDYESEQEDEQHLNYCKIIENMPLCANLKEDDDDELALKPRLVPKEK